MATVTVEKAFLLSSWTGDQTGRAFQKLALAEVMHCDWLSAYHFDLQQLEQVKLESLDPCFQVAASTPTRETINNSVHVVGSYVCGSIPVAMTGRITAKAIAWGH